MSICSRSWIHFGIVISSTMLVTACALRSSAIAPVGANTYEISYNTCLRHTSWVELKNLTLRAAEDYCATLDRNMTDPRITTNGATGIIPKKVKIRFTCSPVKTPRLP